MKSLVYSTGRYVRSLLFILSVRFGFQLTSQYPHNMRGRPLVCDTLSIFSSSTSCRYMTMCSVENIYPYLG